MIIEYILSLNRSGSTKYGEYITETFNAEGSKTLLLGEVDRSCSLPKKVVNLSHLFCSCEKKYRDCEVWGDLSDSVDMQEHYQNIIDRAEDLGYERVVDSSKTLSGLQIWSSLDVDINTHFIVRRPWSWAASRRKHDALKGVNSKSKIWHILLRWFPKNVKFWYKLRKEDIKYTIRRMKYWEIKGSYKNHKHIHTGNDNKFSEDFKAQFNTDKRGYFHNKKY